MFVHSYTRFISDSIVYYSYASARISFWSYVLLNKLEDNFTIVLARPHSAVVRKLFGYWCLLQTYDNTLADFN